MNGQLEEVNETCKSNLSMQRQDDNYLALDTTENINKIFKCKHRTTEKMDIEHITTKEAYIARMKIRSLKEQSRNDLQKLKPCSI